MPKNLYTKNALKEAIAGKLQRHFACEVADATKDQIYEACALVVRDALTDPERGRELWGAAGALPVHGISCRPQPAQQRL